MRAVEPPFEITYQGESLKVTEAEIANRRVFHCQFAGTDKALMLTTGRDNKENKFWTSIPEGRQVEAEEVGKLIAAFIRNK